MTLSSELRRLFGGKSKNNTVPAVDWTEITVPEEDEVFPETENGAVSAEEKPEEGTADETAEEPDTETERKPVDKAMLNAMAGHCDPLTAEGLVEDFLNRDWDEIAGFVSDFVFGKKSCLTCYQQRIYRKYPGEARTMLAPVLEELPGESFFAVLECFDFTENPGVFHRAALLLDETEGENLGPAFRGLTAFPSPEGITLIGKVLERDDWRAKMKAASALAEVGAVSYASAVRASAEDCDETVKAGLYAIAEKMEEETV